jgi:uncharacterized protein YkwD
MLGIGATPAEAISASSQKGFIRPEQSILCEKAGILCSIGNVSTATLSSKKLVVDNSGDSTSENFASPIKNLDTQVTAAPVKSADICSIYSAPSPTPKPEVPSVSSVSYYATPTATITLPSVTPTVQPVVTPAVTADHPLDPEKLFSMINQKRTEAGLPALVKDSAVCAVSAARAPELESDVASGNMHHGFMIRHPQYQSTENMIYMRNEEEAVNWWLNSPVHRAAIYGNYKQSCIVCVNNTCSQIFANINPDSGTTTPAAQ